MPPLRRLFSARRASSGSAAPEPAPRSQPPPLPYSWILTSRLAIGPMPRTAEHWQQLEDAGFRGRFSCCYPDEHTFAPIPDHWQTAGFPLPDHRDQEPLRPEMLDQALGTALDLLGTAQPVYLHCWAGRERSSLMAVALVASLLNKDLFESLEWVRRCHPMASPIYGHLDVLSGVLGGPAGR